MCHKRCSNKTLWYLEKRHVLCGQKGQGHLYRGLLIWTQSRRISMIWTISGKAIPRRRNVEAKPRDKRHRPISGRVKYVWIIACMAGRILRMTPQWPSPFWYPLPLEGEHDLWICWDTSSVIAPLDSQWGFSADFELTTRKIIKVGLT